MESMRNIMQRSAQRLRRTFAKATTPREQITQALEATLRRASQHTQNAIVFVVEIDEFQALHRYYSGQDLTLILKILEDRLNGALLSRDMVRRLDGGQYAIVVCPLRAYTQEDILVIAGQIQRLISVPVILAETQAKVTASVGCAVMKTEALPSGNAALEAARIALMEALSKGPSGLRLYVAQMGERAEMRRALGKDARAAMASGAIQAFFQPQISLCTKEVSGFEALARWQHDDRGLISPAEFLPVLEEAGMMRALGQTMLRDALAALQGWDRQGLKVPQVSVNMCGEELRHPDITHDIKAQLDQFEIKPNRLVIEVLETVYVGDMTDPIILNLNAISKLGCHIDLDDFGTGHTSIKSVRNFAVNRIKIDRSFIVDVDRDAEQQQIVKTILSMANNLAVDTLAEGVETDGEVAHLVKSGCGHAQGFAIARPLPVAEAYAWIKSHMMPPIPASISQRLQ